MNLMLEKFEKSVLEFCDSFGLLPDGGRIMLAVSGGADSVALAYALKRLKTVGGINCDFVVGHVNHNLRHRFSNGDQDFVVQFAGELGFTAECRSVDVSRFAKDNKVSIETAARQLRMESLIEISRDLNCDLIATAHHGDDNAETIAHRLLRGTGFKGLCGIQPSKKLTVHGKSGEFLRPLLGVTKSQILGYCNFNNLDWREDHTNAELVYTRNRIRHLLLPEIQKKCSGSVLKMLGELAGQCRKVYGKISAEMIRRENELFEIGADGTVRISGKVLREYSELVRIEIIQQGLELAGCGLRFITQTHYEKIISLINGAGNRVIELPGRFRAVCEFGNIVLLRNHDNTEKVNTDEHRTEVQIGREIEFEGNKITASVLSADNLDLGKFKAEKSRYVEWFDLDKISGAIYARKRKNGDAFRPIGMAGKKKIGKFLTADRTDYEVRKRLVVFEDDEKIIWAGPVRACQETRITGDTKSILQVKMEYAGN